MRKAVLAILVVILAAVLEWSAASAPPPQPASASTLYEQLGGVYGIAPLVDGLVERLWDNPTLIANKQFVQWRLGRQKVGVKFLLTASFCRAAGGPQQNLGAHLFGIVYQARLTDAEWPAIWSDIELVATKSNLAPEVREELLAEVRRLKPRLLGAKPPPPPPHTRPSGLGDIVADGDDAQDSPPPSLYQQLGYSEGVAGLVDVFVGRIFANQTIMANRDLAAVTGRLTTAGVKYQLTALLCEATGGPERYTPSRVLEPGTVVRITDAEWNAMLGELQFAMTRRYVSADAQKRLVELIESVRPMVVNAR